MGHPRLDQPFVTGYVDTPAGKIPRVSSDLSFADRLGSFKARWKIGRMAYFVDPGLYALGAPDADSPVLVTANYKMSFDWLRSVLPGMNAWILALNTDGINVWCAAGKGTFSTEELVERVESSGLASLVSHRRLILPQLGAPGVAAHQVKRLSGFKVVYGPIRAEDVPAFISAGLTATREMRRKTFSVWERTVLIPVELVGALETAIFVIPAVFFLAGLGGPYGYWLNVLNYGLFAAVAILGALVAGTILAPILLPWLPGRAFSTKGFVTGLAVAIVLALARSSSVSGLSGTLEIAGWLLIIPAISAYLAMNFTGASTYTSLSGVRKEMRWAVPMQIAGAGLGLVLWMASRFAA